MAESDPLLSRARGDSGRDRRAGFPASRSVQVGPGERRPADRVAWGRRVGVLPARAESGLSVPARRTPPRSERAGPARGARRAAFRRAGRCALRAPGAQLATPGGGQVLPGGACTRRAGRRRLAGLARPRAKVPGGSRGSRDSRGQPGTAPLECPGRTHTARFPRIALVTPRRQQVHFSPVLTGKTEAQRGAFSYQKSPSQEVAEVGFEDSWE